MKASEIDLAAYLQRIGYTGPLAATWPVLCDLHFRHVCAIPFENLDVLLGRGIRIDLPALQAKLVTARRGGYCFEQNTLFSAVLRAIGFEVTPLGARVRWQVPADTVLPRTHMTLLVRLDAKPYLVDVGFGGLSLMAPILLEPGLEQHTPQQRRRIVASGSEYTQQAWRSDTWLDVYRFSVEPQTGADYEMANWYTSTHPASRFRQNLIVARAAPDRHSTIANREFAVRHHNGHVEKRALENPEELLAVLDEIFGLSFPTGTRFGPEESPWPR